MFLIFLVIYFTYLLFVIFPKLEQGVIFMEIKVFRKSQTPVYQQVINQIRELILNGELREGLLLPAERKLAEKISVHRNTISKAYQELKAEGYIESIQGKGYKVTYTELEVDSNKKSDGSVPWIYLMREEFLDYKSSFDDLFSKSYSQKGISFAGGIVPPEAYYKEDIKQILKEIVDSEKEDIFEYCHYQGSYQLRKNICNLLNIRGINANPNEIQIVNESNHAIDYLSQLFLKRGDTVITEEPISPDVYRTFALLGAKILTVPLEEDGLKIDILESLIRQNRPKFIYVSSSYNDPTGIITSFEKRKRLLEISYQYKIPIIEDDSASEIRFTDAFIPSLKSLDRMGSVIYIYSFALTFAPGFKLAFILGPKEVITRLKYLLSIHMINLDSINQIIISQYIQKGLYEKNVKQICRCYKEKRDFMCNLLTKALEYGVSFKKPMGGVYLWCCLPDKVDIRKLLNNTIRRGVYLIPGNMFYPNGNKGDSHIRLNYSYPNMSDIKEGITILIDEIRESVTGD